MHAFVCPHPKASFLPLLYNIGSLYPLYPPLTPLPTHMWTIAQLFFKPLYWGTIGCRKPYIFNVYNLMSLGISIHLWNHHPHHSHIHHLPQLPLDDTDKGKFQNNSQCSNGPNYFQASLNYKLPISVGSLDVYLHILTIRVNSHTDSNVYKQKYK